MESNILYIVKEFVNEKRQGMFPTAFSKKLLTEIKNPNTLPTWIMCSDFPCLSMVAEKDTSVYVNLMFYSFILRNIVSAMYTIADIRWLCYTFNILLPCIQAIY